MAAIELASTSLATDANLEAYYKLENTTDSGPNGYTLTNNGTISFAAAKFNNGANCVKTSSQYLSYASSLGYTGSSYSIVGWVKLASQPANNAYWMFFEAEETTQKSAIFFGYNNNGGTYRLYAGRNKYGVVDNAVTDSYTFTTGTWFHCAVTYDGSNAKVYVNGIYINSVASSGNGNAGGSNLSTIGFGDIGSSPYSDGMFDDVAFFSRALTASEVALLATGCPIAFDAATDGGSSTGTSKTYSHTCTGSNLILFVGVIGDVTNDNVTGVTYAGTAMTKVNGVLIPGNRYMTLWYLSNPSTGANNVVVSASSSILIGSGAVSYTGTDQTQVLDTDIIRNTNTVNPGTSITTSVTTVTDNCWVMNFTAANSSLVTAGTGTTARKIDSATYGWLLGDNNAPKTPAGSVSETVGITSNVAAGMLMASFAPYVAVTDLSISVNDTSTITEDLTGTNIDFNLNVNDTLTITESIVMDNLNLGGINLYDTITISENIMVENTDLGGIDIYDSLTISEEITTSGVDLGDIIVDDTIGVADFIFIDFPVDLFIYDSVSISEDVVIENTDLGGIDVYDDITITESVVVENTELAGVDVYDDIVITESVIVPFDLGDISVYEDIVITEDISLSNDLGDINVNDALTITEFVDCDVSYIKTGLVFMRSFQQNKPIVMGSTEEGRPIPMGSKQQSRPIAMEDSSIL